MRYQYIDQKPYCCVGACLEMILNRRKIPNHGQVSIACDLGLTVPEKYATIYPQAIIGPKPKSGYGTQIQQPRYSVNSFFQRHHIKLKSIFFPITNIDNISDFIARNSINDILVCCHCGTLYDTPLADWGHMLVLEDLMDNQVTLLDPNKKGVRSVIPLQQLIAAIKYHGVDNGAGFYIITKP